MTRSVDPTRSMAKQARPLAVVAAAWLVGIAAPAVSAEAQHGERSITCMNQSSGTTWQIKIDYDHSTVDANPASISDAKIAWRDAKDGWHYTLDLKSGDLTCGAGVLHGRQHVFHRCMLDH